MREKPNPITQARLGRLYLETDPDAAFTQLNEALAALPNMSIAWFNMGVWYERNEKPEAARLCFEKAALLENSEALVFVKLGKFYEYQQMLSAAVVQYQTAVAVELAARTEHSRIVLNLYQAKLAEANDMIPKGLLAYCRPDVDFAGICRMLAAFYTERQNIGRAYYYDSLWKSRALETELPEKL
jgi:Tfp pilus assembly protein PilF